MNETDSRYYGRYAEILESTENKIFAELQRILQSVSEEAEHSPVEHICSRIKNADSIQEKLRKKGYPTDAGSALCHLSDAVGIRMITHFIGDVYAILQKIEGDSCWEVVKVKDYISMPKENGYRSLHVIIQLPVEDTDLSVIRAEIQLRTIAMDCWASLEHQMKYKKDIANADLIGKELRRCADEMASTDLTMQTIRELIQAENS